VGELASNLSLDKSTVSSTIEGLVKVGLVDRSIPANNRRSVCIKLTQQGMLTCHQINNENDTYFERALSPLKDEDLKAFMDTFEKITNNMKELNHVFIEQI